MLRVEQLESGYGPMQVLWGPALKVENGSITSLLGPNGAGKSTLLWTVLGSVPVRAGRILFEERDVTGLAPHRKVELGLTLVPEDKHLFREMTVYENLVMGAYRRAARAARAESLDLVFTMLSSDTEN